MEQKYRAELQKGGWYVLGPRTRLGPYGNRFKVARLVEELNINHEIGAAMRKDRHNKGRP